MKTLDEIFNQRRSIRNYSGKPVEEEKIYAMLEAARIAPSACNAQPWRFCVVKDKNLIEKLTQKGLGGVIVPNNWAKTAPIIIVACSELNLSTHKIGEKIQGIQYHLIDIGIALEHMVLKAAELDLGTCYIGWFKGKVIHKLLKLPKSWNVECLVTLGYPQEKFSITPRKKLNEICIIK